MMSSPCLQLPLRLRLKEEGWRSLLYTPLPDLENRNEGHVIHPVTLAVYGLVCEQPCLRETLDKPEGSSALEALGPLPSSGSPQTSLVPTFRLPTPWIDAGSCPAHWIASVTEMPPNNQALGSSK